MDIHANRDLANQVLEKVKEFKQALKHTIQDVKKGKEWPRTIDDRILVTMSECTEKIVELCHQVGGSCTFSLVLS